MKINFLLKNEVKGMQWSGGITNEYIIYPDNANYAKRNFLFRISSATIEVIPSEFTQFEGFSRFLAMLDGDLQLNINGCDKSYKEHELFSFQSSDTIISYSLGKDFNLMLHHSIIDAEAFVLNGSFSSQKNFISLFALSDLAITINNEVRSVAKYDCILIENNTLENINMQLSDKTIVSHWNI